MRLFQSVGKEFREVPPKNFSDGGYEKEIEDCIEITPGLLGDILLIGRQVKTDYGIIDLLALDRDGAVIIIELKRGLLRRDIVGQVNDYLTCVKRWNGDELEQKANLVQQRRPEERALVSRFKEYYKCGKVPELNREQRVILLAETIEEETLHALETPGFPISVLTLSRFQDAAAQFLVVDAVFGEGPSPESADSFFEFFGEVEPALAQDVFSRQKGWHWVKSRKWSRVGFSQWYKEFYGLTVGSGEEESRENRVYVGVAVPPKFAKILATEFKRDESQLRKILGKDFVLDPDDRWRPIYECVQRNPDIVVDRLRKYRDVLCPYLDRVMPPRKQASTGG